MPAIEESESPLAKSEEAASEISISFGLRFRHRAIAAISRCFTVANVCFKATTRCFVAKDLVLHCHEHLLYHHHNVLHSHESPSHNHVFLSQDRVLRSNEFHCHDFGFLNRFRWGPGGLLARQVCSGCGRDDIYEI